MKYIFKTFLILYLLFNFNNSFSQNNNEKKYIKELKSIFIDSKNKKLELMFLNIDVTYTLLIIKNIFKKLKFLEKIIFGFLLKSQNNMMSCLKNLIYMN